MLHHIELWVPSLPGSSGPWGWLLGQLGWTVFQDWAGGRAWRHGEGYLVLGQLGWTVFKDWPVGRSWRQGEVYLVLEQSPALSGDVHDRFAPGLNHVAFTTSGRAEVDRLTAEAPAHGWALLFPDRHPHAG